MDLNTITSLLPHRYPFLLLDKVIECIDGKFGIGIKNVTINEPYFTGHFTDEPIVPGVLIIESCAQLLGIVCANKTNTKISNQYLASVKNFSFKQFVTPGDIMKIETRVNEIRFNLIQAETRVKTQKGLIADGTLIITDRR